MHQQPPQAPRSPNTVLRDPSNAQALAGGTPKLVVTLFGETCFSPSDFAQLVHIRTKFG